MWPTWSRTAAIVAVATRTTMRRLPIRNRLRVPPAFWKGSNGIDQLRGRGRGRGRNIAGDPPGRAQSGRWGEASTSRRDAVRGSTSYGYDPDLLSARNRE